MSLNSIARRQFLKASAAVAGYHVFGTTRATGGQSPNEQVNIACIGVGGKGRTDSRDANTHGNLVAICDIDDQRLAASAAKYPRAKKYNDYRKLLDEMENQIDAVIVTTPDHHHAAAGVRAMRMGKHIYCQKPLTHTVAEARLMRETAREHNVVTQMGNQGTAADGFRAGIELIQSGAIGAIREVHAWTNRPFNYWKQAPDIVARPPETPPVPSHVHWDLFLGPAPVRAYHPAYHPHDWRGWWDFGTGSLGDMACHTTNLAFHALKLGLPTRVSARSGEINPETYPAWATITYEFPQRGELPPVRLTWYEGARDGQRNLPDASLLQGNEPSPSGMLFVGESGSIFTPDDYGEVQQLLPSEKFRDFRRPTPRLERLGSEGDHDHRHKFEWVRAIQQGTPTMSDFSIAATMTEAMLLGNVAVRVGQSIDYDPVAGRVTNCTAAQELIDSEHRQGWTI